MPFYINQFRVTVALEQLECVKEFDSSGHSEPYLWSAFLIADDTTLASGQPLVVTVPLASQPGRGLFGNAGKNVKPGTVLNIPENIGRFSRSLYTHRSDRGVMGNEIMFAGFVAALFEEDSTSGSAIAAGHQELGPALQDEIVAFYLANQRFPNALEIETIKGKVSQRVEAKIRSNVSCWNGFWSDQDDVIGVAGDENTLFTASEIRALSGKGRTPRVTPIRGTEITYQYSGYPQRWVPVPREHHYVLSWSITVEPLELTIAPEPLKQVEKTGSKLEELDFAVGGLVEKLDAADDQLGTKLQTEIEEKVRRIRPALVRDFEVAWAEFAKTLPEPERASAKT